MFVGKAGAYPSQAPFRCSTLGEAHCPTHKHLAGLERDKRSSLLQKFVNYGRKKFYKIGPWAQCYKTFFVRNLRIFVIS
jgi:hypothetical protein